MSKRYSISHIGGEILKVLLPLGISVGLVAWLFHKVDFAHIKEIIQQGVDYRFLLIMMILTALSQIIRGFRWGIQLRAAGIKRMPPLAECVSIFGAYALNVVFPFLGEAWRCIYVSRRQNCKLSTVIGTDIGDRGSDAVMIVLITILAFFVARPALHRFMEQYSFGQDLDRFFTDGTGWLCVLLALIVIAVAAYIFRSSSFVKGIIASASRIWDGFKVIFFMKGRGRYIIYTLGIWICYYLETYMCFFAFPFTRELISAPGMAGGLLPGLVVFVFGSFSMGIPSNGGLGPWNIAVAFALTLYGVSVADATAYSLVCWSFQTLMLILLGIFSAAYIAVSRHKNRNPGKSDGQAPLC